MAAAILFCSNLPQLKLHFSSPSHLITRTSRFRRQLNFSSLPHMAISNSQYGRVSDASGTSGYGSDKIYRRLGSCLVIPPTKGRKPKALIKFLGGAFIGAVPEVTYSYLLGLLAEEGYLIISVPYNVTFDHEQVTREIFERFHACFDSILSSGLPENGISAAEIADLPYYSVGHSNGALLQVLTGSYFCEKIPKANAIISYNNKSASEAVPYFEQLGPVVKQMMPVIETSLMYSMAQSVSVDGWRTLIDVAEKVLPGYDPEASVSLTKFVDQLPSVFNQVAQGTSEFKPTPSENLDCFKKLYNIQNTLLLKFDSDTIDETDLLEETLKPRVESFGGKLEKVILRGTHITPCAQVYFPDFYNWNRVKVRYCDGSSFTGDVEAVNPVTRLHYRGARVFLAVIKDLLARGMKNADNAILSGCSAGGLAAILHCDNFKTLLPIGTKVKCLSDAGFFINTKDVSGAQHVAAYYDDIVTTHGSAKNLPQSCTLRMKPSLCFFPQYSARGIRTPLFLVNAAYDSWQIKNILAPDIADPLGHWHGCKTDIDKCSSSQLQIMQGFRSEFIRTVTGLGLSMSRGLFINSCYAHCQTEMQETWFTNDSPKLNNKTIARAVGDWFYDRSPFQRGDCPYPCDRTCHNRVFDPEELLLI